MPQDHWYQLNQQQRSQLSDGGYNNALRLKHRLLQYILLQTLYYLAIK